MTAFSDVSQGLAQAAALAGPSVVTVKGRRWTPGSGIVWKAAAGEVLIVTASHVLEWDENIQVSLAGGAGGDLPAVLVGRDPATDLAVLKAAVKSAAAAAAQPAPLAQPLEGPAALVGELVLALARPGGGLRASLGVLHAVEGAWRTPAGARVERFVQPDLVMYPGFSGGPLLTAAGAVLGLNTSGLARNTPITLPVETVQRVVETLLAHGRMPRGYLGVGAQPVRLPEDLAQAAGQEIGLLVSSVEPGGPAAQGGLLLGDTLLSIEGARLGSMDDLLAFLNADAAGKPAAVRLARAGQQVELTVTPGLKD